MTRHQRRKAARARKNAKAAILNSRALHVLEEERLKRNLVERRPKGSGKLSSSAKGYSLGYSAQGSGGERLGLSLGKPTRTRNGGRKVKGSVMFDTSQIRDHVCQQGERISASYARERYAPVKPDRPEFKGPFKLKKALDKPSA